MLTYSDIVLIKDHAIKAYVNFPTSCRLPGMVVDLTDDEKRGLAYYEAALYTIFEKLGKTATDDELKKLTTGLYTASCESLDGENVSYNTDKKRK